MVDKPIEAATQPLFDTATVQRQIHAPLVEGVAKGLDDEVRRPMMQAVEQAGVRAEHVGAAIRKHLQDGLVGN